MPRSSQANRLRARAVKRSLPGPAGSAAHSSSKSRESCCVNRSNSVVTSPSTSILTSFLGTPGRSASSTNSSSVSSMSTVGVHRGHRMGGQHGSTNAEGSHIRRPVISGERGQTQHKGRLRRQARVWVSFAFQVILPAEVDEEHVEASMNDGVLHVRVPKSAGRAHRRELSRWRPPLGPCRWVDRGSGRTITNVPCGGRHSSIDPLFS